MGYLAKEAPTARDMRWAVLYGAGVGGILITAVVGVVLGTMRDDRAPTASAAPTLQRSTLAPEPAAIRYRFKVLPTTVSADDSLAGIPTLEARVAVDIPSPYDLGELADLYLRRAMLAADPRDYEKAEATAKRSLAALADPNGAALTVAKVYTARHQFREAIEIATAYNAHSSSTSGYGILATSYLALGDLPQAAIAAETVASDKPSSGAYFMRALVEQAQGRDVEAAYDFARAAAIEEHGDLPEAARLRTLWGRFLLRRGETEGAALCFAEALRVMPGYPLALANQGELMLRTGKPREAKALFEQAFEATRLVRYLIDLARAQEVAGDRTAADATRTQVEKLVRAELTGGGYGHTLELVEILVDRGLPADLTEAISLGREELARRPSADVRFQLARAYLRANRRFDGLTQIHAVLASGARDPRMYEAASRLEALDGNAPRAALYAKEAKAMDPGGPAWRSLGMAPR